MKYRTQGTESYENLPHDGLHIYRRTFASRLLQSGTPLPLISEMLGHIDKNSVRVYLSTDEAKMKRCALDIIDEKMKQLEIRNMSAFLRAMVLNGYVLKLDLPQLREMIRLLGNLTNNVNQIARRVNEHGSIYESEIDEIQEKVNQLLGMMNQLLSTLQLNTV